MGKIKIILALVTAFSLCLPFIAPANAKEPERPRVDTVFDQEKENKITGLDNLPTHEAFGRLKAQDIIIDEELLDKGIYAAFGHRKKEAIEYATNFLKLPLNYTVDGKLAGRVYDYHVSRKIFEVFPDAAAPVLINLYAMSDAETRGNILRTSGKIAAQNIKKLLIKALDDNSFCEEENPETLGLPLRISDVAYNQLVLRYMIPGVLRTISTSHPLEQRDYHIAILRGMF